MPANYSARAEAWAREVDRGVVRTSPEIVAACRRHLSDLEKAATDPTYPYEFNSAKGDRLCSFAEKMVHVKGKWARAPKGQKPTIVLEDWQCFLLAVSFGWLRRADQLRRFREIYAEIPRKNAKSTVSAIIGLYMFALDNEPAAEVFSGATSLEQAHAVFKPAWMMVKNNPSFRAKYGLELGGTEANPGPIMCPRTGSRFAPIIGKPGDGDSPSCAIIDEYHEHVTPVMYDAMKTGMGARTQPMRVVITTAGVDTSGPCYDKHLEAGKVLDGTQENDEMFVMIFAAPKESDWKDFENVWIPANPNYGVSVFEDYLRAQLRDALQNPSQQNINRTKHLNQWMTAGVAWMNMATWDNCRDETLDFSQFVNKPCWLGADLASKIDIASLAYIFRAPWGWAFFCRHYLPEDTIEKPENAHYRKWRDHPRGWLTQTDGARTDLKRIEDDIKDASKMFKVQALAFDQKESNYLITNVQEWASFDCVDVPQAPVHMSEPMKEMEALVMAGQLKHAGDPVLTWMMGNVVKKQGRGGGPVKSYYPTKQTEKNKIDGVVAGIMALSRAMLAKPDPEYKILFV